MLRKIRWTVFVVCAVMVGVVLGQGVVCAEGYPGVSAESAIVMDCASGRVLYEKNAHEKRGMASTTKIMTAIVALERGNLQDTVTVSNVADAVEGSSMCLEAGEKISLENLVWGLMLLSGNDAATAIAEHIPGFVDLMNAKAAELGAVNTSFDNPHGLDSGKHYSTAHDMALIARYGLTIPKFAEIVKTKAKKVTDVSGEHTHYLSNHNRLLNLYPYANGVKTGFTKATGRCLVSSALKPDSGGSAGMQIVAVTLDAPSDWEDHMNMLNYAFNTYKLELIASRGTDFGEVKVIGGSMKRVKLVAAQDFYFPEASPWLEGSALTITHHVPEQIKAPVKEGQVVGYVTVSVGGSEYGAYPLTAQEEVFRQFLFIRSYGKSFKGVTKQVFDSWFAMSVKSRG